MFPLIKAKGGEWVTLMKTATLGGSANTLTAGSSTVTLLYETPTGDINITYYNVTGAPDEVYVDGTNVASSLTSGTPGHIATYPVGYSQVVYNVTLTWTNNTKVVVNSIAMNDSYFSTPGTNNPNRLGVLVKQEKDNATTKDVIFVPTGKEASYYYINIGTPQFSGSYGSGQLQSDSSVTQYVNQYGTFVEYDSDNNGLVTIKYPDTQAIATVAFGSNPTFSVATGTAGTYDAAIKITSPVAKLASEIEGAYPDLSTLDKDLILVGGPCANSLVAKLMNVSNSEPECYQSFTYSTGIIKEYTDAFGSGQKALVVAGLTADDTRNLAAKVMQGTLSFEA
ncbi:MAG: hypothetical protein DRP27_09195 [Thermotogae bacterium]|nr:MAG: hypothetical protein DRP27_09195 [Thermotogota bacterium]